MLLCEECGFDMSDRQQCQRCGNRTYREVDRSAAVMVQIFPAGSGQVLLGISNYGPVRLDRAEMIATLRSAADQLERATP